jgi:hypothetical protein
MAILFNGQYNIQTPNNPLGSAVATMSVSFWFSFTGVANNNPTRARLFAQMDNGFELVLGDIASTSNEFGVFLYGAGNNQLQENLVVQPNTAYLAVATWASGAQKFYLSNDIAFATNNVAGSTNTVSGVVQVGVDTPTSTEIQITVSQPAVYDFVLTDSTTGTSPSDNDIINLLLGSVTPQSGGAAFQGNGGAGNVVWAPTLDGTLNATVHAGDAGLANSGTLGAGAGNEYVLSLMNPALGGGTAKYVADLVYTPSVAFVPYVGKTGDLFYLFVTNVGGTAFEYPTAVNASLTPVVTVAGSSVPLYGPVWANNSKDLPFVAWRLLTPATSGQAITYTIPFGAVTVASGLSPEVVTPTAVPNYTGQLEPGVLGVTPFTVTPTMPLGINVDYPNFGAFGNYNYSRNARYKIQFAFGGAGGVTYNSTTWEPLTLPVNGVVSSTFEDTSNTNFIDGFGYPSLQGVYSIVYDDVNAGNANALKVWIAGNNSIVIGADNAGGPAGGRAGSTWTRTVSGTTVTVSYNLSYTVPNNANGYNMALTMYFKSPTGNWSANDPTSGTPTITNFWIFFPGDSDTGAYSSYSGPYPNNSGNDRSDPYAPSASIVRMLTGTNGNGPVCIRCMDSVGNFGGVYNYINYSDCKLPTQWGWAPATPSIPLTIPIESARFYNTNPAKGPAPTGDGTYAWVSPNLYHPYLGNRDSNGGSDSTGLYIGLAAGGGATDYGAYTSGTDILEFVTTSPHGLRTQDSIITQGSTPFFVPTSGNNLGALAGTASVTHGTDVVTFSQNQTLNGAVTVTFSGDSSGQAYRLSAGTAQTNYTMIPNFQGTTSGAATATQTAAIGLNNINKSAWVTGANTFAMWTANVINSNEAGPYRPSSTSPIPMPSYSMTRNPNSNQGPYGFFARMAAQWPGCAVWVPIMPFMTDACLRSVADEITEQMLPGSTIVFEYGLEHWNNVFPTQYYMVPIGNLLAYIEPDTEITEYYTTPSGIPAPMEQNAVYTMCASHAHNVLEAQVATHNKGINVLRLFGGWYTQPSASTLMIDFANAHNIPMGAVAIAPYVTVDNSNSTWAAACLSTEGNWPAATIHSWARHWIKYDSNSWSALGGGYTALQAYTGPACYGQVNGKPAQVGYESQLQQLAPVSGTQGVPATFTLIHDLWYHPEMSNTWNTTFQSIQDGSPLVPGSGLTFSNIYDLGGQWGGATGQLWSVATYESQVGNPAANVFMTAQGGTAGPEGYGTFSYDIYNNSSQLGPMQNWFAAANSQPSVAGTLAPTEGADAALVAGWCVTASIGVTERHDVFLILAAVLSSPAITRVSPSRVQPDQSSPVTVTLIGSGTAWTSGSSVSIQNSVTGTTTVTAGTFTALSDTSATLAVTTGADTGTFTITIAGSVSPPLVVGNARKRWFGGMSRLSRVG